MDRATAEKIARNNSLFRAANEEIASVAGEHGLDEDRSVPFICECSDRRCTQLIRVPLDEYRSVRRNPRHFIHAKGHEAFVPSAVRTVRECGDYAVVEKVGAAGELASRLAAGGKTD